MSTESVSQFLSVVSSDSALKEKLAAITDSVNFIQIAQASGYNFSLEDLQAYIAQHNNGELSEDELEAVAGGCASPNNCNKPPFKGNSSIAIPKGSGPKPGGVEWLLQISPISFDRI
jgi:predicted ribosomally synthesized peptide with nif11-like leader